jgi:hypothetical protein
MVLALCGMLLASSASGVTIQIDYTYDTSNFFGSGNPSGSTAGTQARTALEAAADFYSDVLEDTLAAIAVPPPFNSGSGTGRVEWNWSLEFFHPSAADPSTKVTLTNQYIPADVFRIFVGARDLPGNELGVVNGVGWSVDPVSTGGFTQQEINQLTSINNTFVAAVSQRGEPASEYAAWGGAISFDRIPNTSWHYRHDVPVVAGRSDLYSVALHEMAHTLGAGLGSIWNGLVSNGRFIGPEAVVEYGGTVPLRCASGQCDHWAEGTQSETFLTSVAQETLLDPTLAAGQRRLLTMLDAAALSDLGWDVAPAPEPPVLAGDYNGDNRVTAADYVVWRNTFGDTGSNLAADGNKNNQVDQGDYTMWKNNFGAVGSGAGSAVVPEPGTVWLMVSVLVNLFARRLFRPGVA